MLIKQLKEVFDSVVDYDFITKKLHKTFLYYLVILLDTLHTIYNIEDYDSTKSLKLKKWIYFL